MRRWSSRPWQPSSPAYAVPPWRDRLRWPVLASALLAVAAIVAAYLTGDHFREVNDFGGPQVEQHAEYAVDLLWATVGFGVVALLTTLLHRADARWLRVLLTVLLVADALAVLVLVVLTGEAGARAVWDGVPG